MLFIIPALFGLVAAAILYGDLRWTSGTRALRDRLEMARLPAEPKVFDRRELEGLPAPVQRYFGAALKDGQPMVAAVSVEHSGSINMGPDAADRWKPFSSTQRVLTRRPGFDWDARISMLPGVSVRVHDAYVAGEGMLHAALFGLVPMAKQCDTGELARGELMRFLAEAAWYPTALLPSQGIRWQAVDDHDALAAIEDGAIALTLLFRFDADGLIDSVRAEARGRTMGGMTVPTPWQGRFWNYALRDGMRVPLDGEAAWVLPQGPKPYRRGRINGLRYELAQ